MSRSIFAAAVAGLLAAGCAASPSAAVAPRPTPTVPATQPAAADPEAQVRICLYESVAAYPTWPRPDQNVLDYLPSCALLPQADKTRLRQMVRAFVLEYDRRSR